MGRRAKPPKKNAEAKRPLAGKPPKNDDARVRDLEKRLAESLEREKAAGEILRVISSSPTDVQPVFDTIVQNAMRLCDAVFGRVFRRRGDTVLLAANANFPDELGHHPAPLNQDTLSGGVISSGQLHLSVDVESDPAIPPLARETFRHRGVRSILTVPMLREGQAIGAISVGHRNAGAFTDAHVALLQTFADQAVIAIENVRLFRELEARNQDLTESLERQTATAEILSVISASPTDLRPVFDAILQSALRLCRAVNGGIWRLETGVLSPVAFAGSRSPEWDALARGIEPIPPRREMVSGWAVLEGQVLSVPDIEADDRFPNAQRLARTMGIRSVLGVPMLREGVAVGAMVLNKMEPAGFGERQIDLVRTFADQAVIAIENVRLFTELEARNRDLTTALEQQTATSEILRVISSSPTAVQPVFEAIVRSAVVLCGAMYGTGVRFDGELMHLVAGYNYTPEVDRALHEAFPLRPSRRMMAGRAILTRDVVQVEDALDDPDYDRGVALAGGFRSMLAVPMLRERAPIGAIVVNRGQPGPFSHNQIELLKTFAAQAVIAVENTRLFTELQDRTAALTRSVGQLTALGEVGQAVSSSLELGTVLNTIVSRAVHLCGAAAGAIFEYDEAGEEFHLRATEGLPEEYLMNARGRRGEGATGRLAITPEPIEIPDMTAPGAYESRVKDIVVRAGHRAMLAVPLLHEGRVLGSLIVLRKVVGAFGPEVVSLLRTFATQSALAIQNARLFREIEAKGRQLATASQHKSEFLANMSHELRTPLNAIIGFSEVLNERMFGELNEKQDEYLKDIYASGQHLLSLINDILDLSKIEAGRMELELADFHLPSAVENALILVRERASRRGIALGHTIDSALGMVRADERKVKQVLLNLLSNALKFTPEGGRVDVRAGLRDDLAEISVADNGVGIAPEDQEAVFEEFRQVGTAAKKVEGTGLGLALSRRFVELHGGRIWVRSQVGEGSTFTFTLPVRREKEMGA